jgi:hypothetical protein
LRAVKIGVTSAAFVFTLGMMCTVFGRERAAGQLHWQIAKKEPLHVRLIALAWAHPRSSFFASEETFIAEKQLGEGEWRLVKLEYGFLPYQPRLSESGLDYSTVHELRAVREPNCDETLTQMSTVSEDGHNSQSDLRYATDAPTINFERHHSMLPCYITSAEDYGKSVHEPPGPQDEF